MHNMRDLKDFNIKTLKESCPMSSQVGLGEDFCIFDVRYDTDIEKDLSSPRRLEGNIILFCVRGSIRMSINLNEFDIVEGSLIIVTAQDIVKAERIYSQEPDQLHFVMIAMSENFVSDLKVDFIKILNEGLTLIETPEINLNNDLQDIFDFEISAEDMSVLTHMPQNTWLGEHPDFAIPKKKSNLNQ